MKPNLTATLALTLGATLLTTTAHAQIAITGGEIIFGAVTVSAFTIIVPNGFPVAGYLETAQGRIQSGNYTYDQLRNVANNGPALFGNITTVTAPVLLRINGNSSPTLAASTTKNLLATGSAFTPNGPVLFTNIPVSVTLGTLFNTSSVGNQNVAGFTFDRVTRRTVTGGSFGTSGSISGMIGGVSQTVSLAPGSFHFTDPFPAPTATPAPTAAPASAATPAPAATPTPAPAAAPVFNLEPNTTGITTTTFTTEDWEERTTFAPTPSPNSNLRRNGIVSRIFPTLSLYQ